MKKPIFYAFLCILLNYPFLSYGQIFERSHADKIVPGSKLVRLNKKDKSIQYIRFGDEEGIKAIGQNEWLGKSLKLSKNHSLKKISEEKDFKGFTHAKYQVCYKNIPVEGSFYQLHSMPGNMHSVSGEYINGRDIPVSPAISEQQALEFAKSHVNAQKYFWQITNTERPKGELTIISVDSSYVLTYKFDIFAIKPLSRQFIYVNANNGKVVKEINRIMDADVTGTAETMYNGTVNITTDSFDGGFRLRESARGNGIETYIPNYEDWQSPIDFISANNFWNDNTNYNNAAYDAHYGAEVTYDYYYNQFNRNSFDNAGGKIINYVHFGNWPNAQWFGSFVGYGDGDGVNTFPFTSLDIVAHEITHGVTEYTAGLIPATQESGALNESFSDIFGVAIDFYKNPTTANFLMGDQVSATHTPLRSLQDPNSLGYPNTYLGKYWDPNQETHKNATVMDYWFYLLCKGGSGKNDNGNVYKIDPIGMEKSIQIAYRNLTVYLTPNATYADARFYSILAAIDLYGTCSPEVSAVTNAWYAVGVGEEFADAVKAEFASSTTTACEAPAKIYFYNKSIKGSTFVWDFGDKTKDTAENPMHTYKKAGTYTVTLAVTGNALCGTSNAIQKVNFISVAKGKAPAMAVCAPQSFNPGQGGIYSFAFNTINNETGGSIDNYQDYSCSNSTSTKEGKKYKISVQVGDKIRENVSVWLDLNNNGKFDGTELLLKKEKVDQSFSDSIIIPGGAQFNTPLRLRVVSDYMEYPIANACTNSNYGQAQDYAVIIAKNTSKPKSDFSSNKNEVISGDTVKFTDETLNVPLYWKWSFAGGTPATSSEKNPKIVYKTPGLYNVTLTTGNSHGTDEIVRKGCIQVITPSPEGLVASLQNKHTGQVDLQWFPLNETNYIENFDGNANKFLFSDDSAFSIENSNLKVFSASEDYSTSWKSACINANYEDFVLQFKYKIEEGKGTNNDVTAFIRSNGFMNNLSANGYAINIGRGYFYIWKVTTGAKTGLANITLSPVIDTTRGAWNLVTIEAMGSNIKININNQLVSEFNDNTYANGKINLCSMFATSDNSLIRWDSISVFTNLPALTTSDRPPIATKQCGNTNVFKSYKLYRDNKLIYNTKNTTFTDTLPAFGIHQYKVSSVYEKEESPTNPVKINWPAIKPGEYCAVSQNLAGISSPFQGTTVGYENDFNFCNGGGQDRVFYIDVPAGEVLKIGLTSADYYAVYSLRMGNSCPGETAITCGNSEQMSAYINSDAVVHRIYMVVGSGGEYEYGNFTLEWGLSKIEFPVANFTSGDILLPIGSGTTFTDLSTGPATNWQWEFPGSEGYFPGYIINSQDPGYVYYDQAGSYDVKLIVSNFLGYDTIVKTGYITVSNQVYCSQYIGGQGYCPGDISEVSITNTSLDNTDHSNCSAANGATYARYPATNNTTATLTNGETYEFMVTTTGSSIVSLWIDFNQSGRYDESEWSQISPSSIAGEPNKVSITIPVDAAPGLTGMRIRTETPGGWNNNGPYDACSYFISGFTEDYLITILPASMAKSAQPGLTDITIALFPNPVDDILNIKSTNTLNRAVVTDAEGRVLISTALNDQTDPYQINFSRIQPGLYNVTLYTQEGVKTYKVLKVK